VYGQKVDAKRSLPKGVSGEKKLLPGSVGSQPYWTGAVICTSKLSGACCALSAPKA